MNKIQRNANESLAYSKTKENDIPKVIQKCAFRPCESTFLNNFRYKPEPKFKIITNQASPPYFYILIKNLVKTKTQRPKMAESTKSNDNIDHSFEVGHNPQFFRLFRLNMIFVFPQQHWGNIKYEKIL